MTITTAAMKSVMNTIGGFLTVGCSVVVTFGFISRMIQIIRFMNIGYSPKLKDVLLTWGTDILSLNIPQQIDEKIVSHDINSLFSTYGIEPNFLSNFWGTMVTLLVATSSWVLLLLLLLLFPQA